VFSLWLVNYGFLYGGLILSGGRLFYMAKDGLFFKQATILNKTKFRQSIMGTMCLGLYFVFW
jgi:hypothetical protein